MNKAEGEMLQEVDTEASREYQDDKSITIDRMEAALLLDMSDEELERCLSGDRYTCSSDEIYRLSKKDRFTIDDMYCLARQKEIVEQWREKQRKAFEVRVKRAKYTKVAKADIEYWETAPAMQLRKFRSSFLSRLRALIAELTGDYEAGDVVVGWMADQLGQGAIYCVTSLRPQFASDEELIKAVFHLDADLEYVEEGLELMKLMEDDEWMAEWEGGLSGLIAEIVSYESVTSAALDAIVNSMHFHV